MPPTPSEAANETNAREQSQAATRSAILSSAEDQFLSKGYLGASLDDIAEAAGFSKGAIYSNFSSKDELFLAVSHERGLRTSQRLLDALAGAGDGEARLAVFSNWLRSRSATDNEWVMVDTEFTVVGRRNPQVAAALRERYRDNFAAFVAVLSDQLDVLDITPAVEIDVVVETMLALERGLALSNAVDPVVGADHLIEVLRALLGFPAGPESTASTGQLS